MRHYISKIKRATERRANNGVDLGYFPEDAVGEVTFTPKMSSDVYHDRKDSGKCTDEVKSIIKYAKNLRGSLTNLSDRLGYLNTRYEEERDPRLKQEARQLLAIWLREARKMRDYKGR